MGSLTRDIATAPRQRLSVLYRGRLNSCNYGCAYCPFAKQSASRRVLERDAAELARFVDWCAASPFELSVLFTPWGEALIHRAYREAIERLAAMQHVAKAAIQTNLSCSTSWMLKLPDGKAAFWCTFHPGETPEEKFIAKCHEMADMGVRFSVGMVGRPEFLSDIRRLRDALPEGAYLWINALRGPLARPLSREQIEAFAAVDPLFELNLLGARSRGRACAGGETTIAVDGDGAIRRCHFIDGSIGNIYDPAFIDALQPRACTAQACRCHIGYVHMPELDLDDLFGEGLLERIPTAPPQRIQAEARLALMRGRVTATG